MYLLNNNVLKDQPIRPMALLGVSVIGSAGFAWSGDIERLGGGDTGCCIAFFGFTPEPNPWTNLI